ncbi:Fis family transcriptional regulator [candidate division KSB1 bacterium]|nr:MAG: Fis family transcriptional regulator [candidate division KSB1 bacterium]
MVEPMDTEKNPVPLAMDGVLVVDRELKIISFSKTAERITGYSAQEAVGKPLQDILGPDTTSPSFPILDTLQNGRIFSNLDILFVDRNNVQRSLSVTLSPLCDIQGKVSGVVVTFRDVAEMQHLAYQLMERTYEVLIEKNKLEAILNSITDGVLTIDPEWRITSFNRAAQQITGYSQQEALGQNCGSLLRGSACGQTCPMRRTIETGQPTYNAEVEIITKDGQKIPISVNTALLYDDDGNVVGAVESFRDLSKIRQLTLELEERYRFDNILGKSKPMQELYKLLENVVETDATVLIQGESGTGKELVARAIHYNGPRRNKPFVAVSCSALAESLLESELFGHEKGAFTGAIRTKPGRFELANGGTLFLDEIGDVSPAVQVKLLRVLDEQKFERVGGTKTLEVDVRVIAATNKNLLEEVRKGNFREDLYYRLNVVPIWLPPLRERKDDIPLLVQHFIDRFNRKMGKNIRGVSSQALECLMSYHWPGNIRELENAIEQAFVRCRGDEINVEHLPATVQAGTIATEVVKVVTTGRPFEEAEKQVLLQVLREVGGSRTEAARRLGLSKATLWRKMKKFGLL